MSSSQNKPAQFFLQNLYGSSTAFIIEAIFKNEATAGLNHLIVLNDAEEAAYFFNSVESLTEALDLFYFPSSFGCEWINATNGRLWI